MSYVAKVWKTGEVITASALNNLESALSQNASDIQEIQSALPTYVGDSVTKKAAATYTPGTSNQTIAGGQYLSGAQTIKGDSNLLPGNIKSGTKIFGITGTYTGSTATTSPTLQSKTVTPTKETQNVTADSSYDGLSQVTVNPIPSDYIIPSGNKVIIANGTEIDVNDYATVDVNVPDTGGIDTSDADATSSDIAEGKTAYVNGVKVTGEVETPEAGDDIYAASIEYRPKSTSSITGLTSPPYVETKIVPRKNWFLKEDNNFWILTSASLFGDSTADDVVSGKTFTSTNGVKVTGTHICSGGIDTSDATATASDIASGKTAYVNGNKITGSLATKTTYSKSGTPELNSAGNIVLTSGTDTEGAMIINGSTILKMFSAASNFGDATAEDVAAGKTFTSTAGVKVSGTATGSSGGGLTMKTGTTTSGTIETGLSSVTCIVIYKSSVSATGLVQMVWRSDESKGHYTCCSSYSGYMKSYAVGTNTSSTVSGGTFTWGGSGTSGLSSSTTYNWIAFGEV